MEKYNDKKIIQTCTILALQNLSMYATKMRTENSGVYFLACYNSPLFQFKISISLLMAQ